MNKVYKKINGGQPGTQKNWSHDSEQGEDDSPMTMTNGVFGGSLRE
jgi:hypothetical protein